MKRNVTISLDEETARWTRVEAARRDVSVSRFVGDLLVARMRAGNEYQRAMESYLSTKPVKLRDDPTQPYPSREELHDRAALR